MLLNDGFKLGVGPVSSDNFSSHAAASTQVSMRIDQRTHVPIVKRLDKPPPFLLGVGLQQREGQHPNRVAQRARRGRSRAFRARLHAPSSYSASATIRTAAIWLYFRVA